MLNGRFLAAAIPAVLAAAVFTFSTVPDATTLLPLASPSSQPITPLAQAGSLDGRRVALGRRLFFDTRLSGDGTLACNSCHQLDQAGADNRARSVTADGQSHLFNAPTIFNAVRNFRLNWRGNFLTLAAQNEAVLLDVRLMNTSWPKILTALAADPSYRHHFSQLYGREPARNDVLDALAEFQRSLVTPNARFDLYLAGNPEAITPAEKEGYELFTAYGCVSCHQGENIGGNLFQRFGIFGDPVPSRDSSEGNLGRFALTGAVRDRFVFRVPSLRNVAVTAPYFHDGSARTLEEAVEIMARVQLGRELPKTDIDLIVRFLGTLTGEYQGRLLSRREEFAP